MRQRHRPRPGERAYGPRVTTRSNRLLHLWDVAGRACPNARGCHTRRPLVPWHAQCGHRIPMAMPAHSNIASLLWSTAAGRGLSPAVIERASETCYATLRGRAAAIAEALLAAGLLPNDRVAILLENGLDAVAAFFGVVGAGGIAVLLNQALRPRQMAQMLG